MNSPRADHAAASETGPLSEVAQVARMANEGLDGADQSNPGPFRSAVEWPVFNLTLFALYLGFFHLCLVTPFPISLAIGLMIAAAMGYLCVRFYRLFANRYEFWFYLALPLDVILEGLIPFHSGYSFYWCATAFGLVFGLYRVSRPVTAS